MAQRLTERLDAEQGRATIRRFPDGESYVRIESPVLKRRVIVVCTLDRPDEKVLPLLFLLDAVRDLGASDIGLIAPYLAYMRQDRRFLPGEEVSSRYFGRLLSSAADWLSTVDPHLHRYESLGSIFSIPTVMVHAGPLIADWVRREIARPLIVGPDSESGQWVKDVSERLGAPHAVLRKVRHGDREVEITVDAPESLRGFTPVLVDDIISTGRTMAQAGKHLMRTGSQTPVCIGIHAVFADGTDEELRTAGIRRVVTCNTVPHSTNAIDVTEAIATAVADRIVCAN